MEPVLIAEQGFFPLDEELALQPGNLAPSLEDHLSHLASWMPFRRAREMLERFLGVHISEATIRRHTEAVGALSEQQQTAESKRLSAQTNDLPVGAAIPRLVLSGDGAYVGLTKGTWAEVRTLVIGEVESLFEPEQEVQTQALSYFSRMTDAATFTDVAEVETRRRKVVQAEQVCAVTDGADWLQGFIDVHRADALRILDFPHAAQRFGMIAEVVAQSGRPLPTEWVQQQCHDLKHLGPRVVLERLRALPELAGCEEHLRYLEKREELMQYPTYQATGWPIGSGIVESGNKVVMQTRLKGPGMRWEPKHVNPMLALRTAICNDRWDEAWQDITQQRRLQCATKRKLRADAKRASLISSLMLFLLRFHPSLIRTASPPPVPPSSSSVPAATLPGSCRPSSSHPWKRSPTCRPKLAAKK